MVFGRRWLHYNVFLIVIPRLRPYRDNMRFWIITLDDCKKLRKKLHSWSSLDTSLFVQLQ